MNRFSTFTRTLLAGLCCSLAAAGTAFAGFAVKVDRGFNTEFTVTCAQLAQQKLMVNGKAAVALTMDDAVLNQEKGLPELPVMSAFLMVSSDQQPELKIIDQQFDLVELGGVVKPSKGHLPRSTDPDSVPYEFGKTYENNAWYPSDKDLVKVEDPFLFRDVRGVRLTVSPVQYNPVTNQLRVYKSFRGKVVNGSAGGSNIKKGPQAISRTFEPLYKKFFLNFRGMAGRLPRLNENGRLVIIAHDTLFDAIQPLVVWKKKCGIEVKAVKLSETGATTGDQIKAFLQTEFDSKGFTHVILVGDAPQIPTLKGVKERADSDPCYVKLAGNDNVPDAIISRISATKAEEVAYQVAKFINYEQFPIEGADAAFYTKAMGIASSEGSPTDFERMEELRTALLKKYTDMDQIYDSKKVAPPTSNPGTPGGYTPDYPDVGGWGPHIPGMPFPHLPPMMALSVRRPDVVPATPADPNTPAPTTPTTPTTPTEPEKPVEKASLKEQVAKGVNEGRGLINYIGHGSKDMWVTSGFGTADCRKLQNGWKMPFIISVACVNGDFVSGADCFCEAWLKAGDIENPRGAVGIFGASTNQSWVPPCIVQAEINSNYIINETYKNAGGLMMNGIIKGLEQYGTENTSEGVKMLEQWHWFGDCTTLVRTKQPVAAKVEAVSAAAEDVQKVDVVVTADGKPVANARVTIYTEKMDTVVTAVTTAEGRVTTQVRAAAGTQGYLTVVGSDLVPVVDQPITF